MPEGDGADELVSGVSRVLVTGAGVVAENALRRRADQDRQRADDARAQAEGDRARTGALRDVDAADPRRRAAEEVTAVAVLRRDDRARADVDPVTAFERSLPPEEQARRNRLRDAMGVERIKPADVGADRAPTLRAPLEPDVVGARDVAARSFAQAATAAVRDTPATSGKPARARTRGRSAERDRGR